MKKLFLLVASIFLISSAVDVTHALTSEEQNIVDRVITRWHARQPADLLVPRTQAILDRIDDIQERARLTPEASMLLNYVEIRLTNILNALANKPLIPTSSSSTTTTNPTVPQSNSFPSTLPIPARFDTNPLIIAGNTSSLLREIKYSVNGEPMIITELHLTANRDTINNRVREFALYDENWTFVATTTSDWRSVNFDALNFRREIGAHRFYLALLPYTSSELYTVNSVSFTLSLQDLYAEWVYSNDTIRPSLQNTSSPTITISPIGIGTVQFIDNRNGYRADSYLANAETTLGIVEIGSPFVANRTEEDIVLDTLSIHITDNTASRQVASNLRLERLDTPWSSNIAGSVQGNIVTFQLSSLGSEYNVMEQGQSAVFRISAYIQLDNWSYESVQINIPNLKNGWLTYHLEGSNETITTIQQAEWEIFGDRISD